MISSGYPLYFEVSGALPLILPEITLSSIFSSRGTYLTPWIPRNVVYYPVWENNPLQGHVYSDVYLGGPVDNTLLSIQNRHHILEFLEGNHFDQMTDTLWSIFCLFGILLDILVNHLSIWHSAWHSSQSFVYLAYCVTFWFSWCNFDLVWRHFVQDSWGQLILL